MCTFLVVLLGCTDRGPCGCVVSIGGTGWAGKCCPQGLAPQLHVGPAMARIRQLFALWTRCQRAVALCENRIVVILELARVLQGQRPQWQTRSAPHAHLSARMLLVIVKGILELPPTLGRVHLLVEWLNEWFAAAVFVDLAGGFGTAWQRVGLDLQHLHRRCVHAVRAKRLSQVQRRDRLLRVLDGWEFPVVPTFLPEVKDPALVVTAARWILIQRVQVHIRPLALVWQLVVGSL